MALRGSPRNPRYAGGTPPQRVKPFCLGYIGGDYANGGQYRRRRSGKGIEFYGAAFGLHLGRRLFEGSVAEMLGATSTIHLLFKPSRSAAVPSSALSREYKRHWTPVHLDFAVEDVSAMVERAVRTGAKLEGEIQSFEWGRLAVMSDPFGHGFCILQFVGPDYDAAA
jgi:uncharacterized glyoxalase superfamily protein PhnB